ncbi:MAG: hypothetical protein OEV93_01580 [Candidatus Moranbacteria bacterium]|nr:hypothetical protein [Candidatus Moranbacteria bacterium]
MKKLSRVVLPVFLFGILLAGCAGTGPDLSERAYRTIYPGGLTAEGSLEIGRIVEQVISSDDRDNVRFFFNNFEKGGKKTLSLTGTHKEEVIIGVEDKNSEGFNTRLKILITVKVDSSSQIIHAEAFRDTSDNWWTVVPGKAPKK